MKMKKAIAVIFLLFAGTAFAASFECPAARTPIEKAICSHPELSALDEQLASAYHSELAMASDPGQLKHEQRTWITEVRNQCEDTDCLVLAYQRRIDDLTSAPRPEQAAGPDAVPSPDTATPALMMPHQAPDLAENTQPAQVPMSEAQPMPGQQNTVGPFAGKPQGSGLSSLQWKFLALALLVNTLLTIYFHKAGKLIIYRDYTDATFTGFVPLLSFLMYFLLGFFEVPSDIAQMISIGFFAVLMLFVVISTARNNSVFSVFFLMSLTTKIIIVGLYYVIMAMLLFGAGSARRKGESQTAFAARERRESRANAAAMAATTTGFVALSAWVCKYTEFTPLNEYFVPGSAE